MRDRLHKFTRYVGRIAVIENFRQKFRKEQGTVLCSSSNNSATFSGKPIGSEEFLNRMVEALDIIIDIRPKGRSRKMEK